MTDFEDLTYDGRGPINWDVLMHVIATVQARLDLVTVLRELFSASLEVAGQRWKTACFLPSAVDSFDGTCAEQDAAGKGNHAQTTNLWVEEGDTTRVWRCHSCERHGDVIDLIMYAEGRPLSTSTSVSLSAVRRGAQLAGVLYMLEQRAPDDRDDASEELVDADAPARIVKPPVQRVEFRRARAINARAAKHWHAMLKAGPGYLARAELKRRGVTDEQAERFVLGCALDKWRDLVDALPHAARDDAQVLGLMGVTRNGKNKGQLYDRYRNRIVWPYCDPARDGRSQSVTGFAARTLSPDDPRKWYNSVNTEGVWHKDSALLGLLQAQALMRKLCTDRVTVGEGGWEILAFDRIAAPCVGPVASQISSDHVHVIATVLKAQRITLAADGDDSGRRGVINSAIAALTYGYALADLDVIDPPDGIDPGKMGETEDGTRALADAYAKPQPLLEFIHAREDIAREQQKRELIVVLPIDVARELAARWGHAFDRADEAGAGEALAPAASFAAQLAAAPALAAHLSGAEVRGVFAEDMLTARQLDAHTFGASTNLHALPPTLRAAWLACLADHIDCEIKTHSKLDPFAGGKGHASFAAWYARDEELRSNRKDARKMLASLQS